MYLPPVNIELLKTFGTLNRELTANAFVVHSKEYWYHNHLQRTGSLEIAARTIFGVFLANQGTTCIITSR